MTRVSFFLAGALLLFASVAHGQSSRNRTPANPRYFPDLYKGPAWGMTLSEYYTFGNKADGPFGYGLYGYRYGSFDDVTRWKQATGTGYEPGYYLQRWRARRESKFEPSIDPKRAPSQTKQAIDVPEAPQADSPEPELAEPISATLRPASQMAKKSTHLSSRRNASERGIETGDARAENSHKTAKLAAPEQSVLNRVSSGNSLRFDAANTADEDDNN